MSNIKSMSVMPYSLDGIIAGNKVDAIKLLVEMKDGQGFGIIFDEATIDSFLEGFLHCKSLIGSIIVDEKKGGEG